MIGQRFGSLTVLCEAPRAATRQKRWLVRCDCGGEFIRRDHPLRHGGDGQRCVRCHAARRMVVEVGQRYGRLTVIAEDEVAKGGQMRWLVRCDCGNEFTRRCDGFRRAGVSQCCPECRDARPALDEGRRGLAEEWYPWAIGVARKWRKHWWQYDDEILSAVALGLIGACRDHDPERHGSFEVYCLRQVYRQIRTDLRRTVRYRDKDLLMVKRVAALAGGV